MGLQDRTARAPARLTAMATASAAPSTQRPLRLSGDLFIWYVIALELATFSVMFVAFAFTRARHVDLFNTAQQQLDVGMGALNTALLLTASWCVAHAVHALRDAAARRAALAWLGVGWVLGAGFVGVKIGEYADKVAQGIGLSTNLFFDFYFILTGFHLAHVLVGLVALAIVGVGIARRPDPAAQVHGLETAAAFWHLVDLLWLVLFPLVYVMR